MAALMEHGSPTTSGHMHPFFQRQIVRGAVPSSSSNHDSEFESILSRASSGNGEIEHFQESGAAQHETQQLFDGRKRRKISVEPVVLAEQHGKSSVTVPLEQEAQTWHEQLQDAADTLRLPEDGQKAPHGAVVINRIQSQEPDPQRSTEVNIQAQEQCQPDHDGSFCSQILPHHVDQIPKYLTEGTESRIPEEQTMTTPKKKSMRIGRNGKLTTSPPCNTAKRSASLDNRQIDGSLVLENKSKRTTSRGRKVEVKKGKLIPSHLVVIRYMTPSCGKRVDEILSSQRDVQTNHMAPIPKPQGQRTSDIGSKKVVHPFFSGNLRPKPQLSSIGTNEISSTASPSEDEAHRTSPKAPKAWKDITFKSKVSRQKVAYGQDPSWPPLSTQNVQPDGIAQRSPATDRIDQAKLKAKLQSCTIAAEEDILKHFALQLKTRNPWVHHVPQRMVMSGKALFDAIRPDSPLLENKFRPSMRSLEARIVTTPTTFDRGLAADAHLWAHEYGPKRWQDVLQPQSKVLYDWLSALQVHNVQSGQIQAQPKIQIEKKRRKRKSDELDDFITHSDDDEAENKQGPKNAILLVGPSGSGKTASVFAVAQQLGFEIFEIHPGTRRNAKDILDKVGDMTQNHLVQQATENSSRRSSISASDTESTQSLPLAALPNQKTMASFMGLGKKGKRKTIQQNLDNNSNGKEAKGKQQKQSLILFEEVDILFEDDKGFWSGVQTLIQMSKRPVILTCNDPASIPFDDLDLFTILTFSQPAPDLAVNYLHKVAAAEGHLLQIDAITNLYLTKDCDLRASLAELNLWCQMAVGSKQGGLDWFIPDSERHRPMSDGSVIRTVSKDTYVLGHDLLPQQLPDKEELIRFAQDELQISPLDWVVHDGAVADAATEIQRLEDHAFLCEAKSALDLLDEACSPLLAAKIKDLSSTPTIASPRTVTANHVLEKLASANPHVSPYAIFDSLAMLSEETRIGLPGPPGRKSHTLDTCSTALVTEVAPYIRSIVNYDQRLELLRNEMNAEGSSQGSNKKQRRTRASRAAQEGTDKAFTRRDKWFTDALNIDAVLATGGDWPRMQVIQEEYTVNGLETQSSIVYHNNMESPSPKDT